MLLACVHNARAFPSPRTFRRTQSSLGMMVSDYDKYSIRIECERAIRESPSVLILHRERPPVDFSGWKGIQADVGWSSDPSLLPMIGQSTTVTAMTTELLHNLDRAQRIREGFGNAEKELCLVGSGAAYGVGKTSITAVIYDCLRELFTPHGYTVVHCYLDGYGSSTPYQKWIALCLNADALKGIRSKIEPSMTIAELLKTTEDYLAANNLFMFLHMDEFHPFNEDGTTEETQKAFRTCWEEMLMPILRTPRICLYISGRMAYFDGLARERDLPCRVLSAHLELLSRADIRKAFRKMAIPSPDSAESGAEGSVVAAALMHALSDARTDCNITSTAGGVSTIPLSTSLDQLLPATGKGRAGSAHIAARVHELTGGVPRSVAEAMHALLSEPAVSTALFDQNSSAISRTELNQLFRPRGDVYRAVKEAALRHFGIIAEKLAAHGGIEATQSHFAGLLQMVLLSGQTIQVTEEDVRLLRAGDAGDPAPSQLQRLLREAQVWGIYYDLNVRAKTLKFKISPPMVEGLIPRLAKVLDFKPLLLFTRYKDTTGESARLEVKRVLLLHRVLAGAVPHPNWLGLSEDPSSDASVPSVQSLPPEDIFKLPCLPVVVRSGELNTAEEVAEIAYFRNTTDTRRCPPRLVGEFLSALSKDDFHVITTPKLSACANFMIRYGDEVTHLQVKDSEALGFTELRREIAKLVPIVQSAPELKHTLAMVVMQPSGRADALRELSMPREALAQKLRDAARAGELTAGDADAGDESGEGKREYALKAASLVEQGRIVVRVLDDVQVGRFFRHRELVQKMVAALSPVDWFL